MFGSLSGDFAICIFGDDPDALGGELVGVTSFACSFL
jgi:hypothetical protein